MCCCLMEHAPTSCEGSCLVAEKAKERALLHNHDVVVFVGPRRLVACLKCGRWAEGSLKGLAKPCPEAPVHACAREGLRRLRDAKHPRMEAYAGLVGRLEA